MEVLEISSKRIVVKLAGNRTWGSNKVDLLTGPNGSGKTEILTALAATLRGQRGTSRREQVVWTRGSRTFDSRTTNPEYDGPERIIAQTFSPFTRFAKPLDANISLTSIYSEGALRESRYVCVGLHRSTRLVGQGISKQTLEQAIYRLSETPESAGTIFKILRNLNFEESLDLTYEAAPLLVDILTSKLDDVSIDRVLSELMNRGATYSRTGLSAELRRTDRTQLAELMHEALRVLAPKIGNGRRFHQYFGFREGRNSYDFATLQSLAFLRRLDLLKLKSCELTSLNGGKFDVADASSGQQQMLCSVIGLATALKNESLVLVDEPELSLHPRWQRAYLDNLRAALMPFEGCHVVIATHSPLIVQRGQALAAGIIQLGQAQTQSSMQSTSSVEGTLLDVFNTPVSGSVHLASEIFSVITKAEAGDLTTRQRSLEDLARLKALYSDPQVGDAKALELIEEAIDLLQTNGEEDA
jgi:predicted ATPase